MDDVQVKSGESYTLSEVIEAVKQTLDGVSKQSTENELRYSSVDVYWLLHDMLRYVNRNVPGEFSLFRIRKGVYRVKYAAEDTAKQKSNRKLKAEVNQTARYLEELTGRRPAWGDKEPSEQDA